MGDDLRKLAEAVACGQRVLRTIRQNIIAFAVVFNLASVAAASSGWISPVTAAVVHQVSSLAVVLNSLRLLVDLHAWRHRLGDWWYDIKRLRWRIAAAAAAVGACRLSGQRTAHDRRRRARRGPAVRQAGLAAGATRAALSLALSVCLALCDPARRDASRGNRLPQSPTRATRPEPPAYEWNVQHRGGRYLPVPEESYVWTGDENLIDVNLVVHYRVADPEAALFKLGVAEADLAARWDELVRGGERGGLPRGDGPPRGRRPAGAIAAGNRRRRRPPGQRGAWTAAPSACRSSRSASATSTRRWKSCRPFATFPSPWRKRRPASTRPRPTSTRPRPRPAGRRPSGCSRRKGLPPIERSGPRPPPARFLEVAAAYAARAQGHRPAALLANDGNRPGRQTESDRRRRRTAAGASLYLGRKGLDCLDRRRSPDPTAHALDVVPPTSSRKLDKDHCNGTTP